MGAVGSRRTTTRRKPGGSRRSIDPGVAAIAAAAVAALAGVTVAIIDRDGGKVGPEPSTVTTALPPSSTTEASTTTALTVATTAPPTTATPSTETPSTETRSTAVPTTTPIVQIVSSMGEREREIIRAVATELRDAAGRLPLVVNDDFTENEYGWPTGEEVFSGGSSCIRSVGDGLQSITIQTAAGAAFCRSGLDKRLSSFTLRLDVKFDRAAPSFGSVWYRSNDDVTSYYSLTFQPVTRSLGLNVVVGGVPAPILAPTYVDNLLPTGTNRIDLVVLGTSHLVYVNDELAVMVTEESRITDEGSVNVAVQLDEPEAALTMFVSRFEVHGSDRPIGT